MASRYYGLNRGQTEFQVTEGASTGSTDIELRVDTGKSLTKNDIILALEYFINIILKNASNTWGL